MDNVTNEELIELAKKIGVFFAQLKANGISEKLAGQLTRDYFNFCLSQGSDSGEDDDGEVPDPMWPPPNPIYREFSVGLDTLIKTGLSG